MRVLWENGRCDRCLTKFGKLAVYQKLASVAYDELEIMAVD
ncbi:MAG: hypothetical protein WBB28_23975 [Crinalium sp.]